MTRQNSIPKASPDNNDEVESKPIPALIPLWDMANHMEGVVTSSFNQESDRIESAAFMDFQKGEQIFIYYGARNNTNFLIHNGYIYGAIEWMPWDDKIYLFVKGSCIPTI